MRVRVLKDFSIKDRTYHAGEIVDIDLEEAKYWLKTGLAMQDKSLNGAKEKK